MGTKIYAEMTEEERYFFEESYTVLDKTQEQLIMDFDLDEEQIQMMDKSLEKVQEMSQKDTRFNSAYYLLEWIEEYLEIELIDDDED